MGIKYDRTNAHKAHNLSLLEEAHLIAMDSAIFERDIVSISQLKWKRTAEHGTN